MEHRIGNLYAIQFGPVRGVYLLAACGTCHRTGKTLVGLIGPRTGEQWHRPYRVGDPKHLTAAEFDLILDVDRLGIEYVTLGPMTGMEGIIPEGASIERTPRRIA